VAGGIVCHCCERFEKDTAGAGLTCGLAGPLPACAGPARSGCGRGDREQPGARAPPDSWRARALHTSRAEQQPLARRACARATIPSTASSRACAVGSEALGVHVSARQRKRASRAQSGASLTSLLWPVGCRARAAALSAAPLTSCAGPGVGAVNLMLPVESSDLERTCRPTRGLLHFDVQCECPARLRRVLCRRHAWHTSPSMSRPNARIRRAALAAPTYARGVLGCT
jgi:hypothetical protein